MDDEGVTEAVAEAMEAKFNAMLKAQPFQSNLYYMRGVLHAALLSEPFANNPLAAKDAMLRWFGRHDLQKSA